MIRIFIKDEIGRFVSVADPYFQRPSALIMEVIRDACSYDFETDIYYRASDVLDKIEEGMHRLLWNKGKFGKYNSPQGCSSTHTAWLCLNGIKELLRKMTECEMYNGNIFDIEHLYLRF